MTDRHSLKAEKICRQVNKWGRGQAAAAAAAANSNGRTNRDGNNPTQEEEEKQEAAPLQLVFFCVLIGTHLPAAVAVTAPLHFTLSQLILNLCRLPLTDTHRHTHECTLRSDKQ